MDVEIRRPTKIWTQSGEKIMITNDALWSISKRVTEKGVAGRDERGQEFVRLKKTSNTYPRISDAGDEDNVVMMHVAIFGSQDGGNMAEYPHKDPKTESDETVTLPTTLSEF